MRPLTPTIDRDRLRPVARARILYADTDKMGIVYHASYLRYLELARVELLRGAGLRYPQMEQMGLGLPLVEMGVGFSSPGLYDDHITVYAGLSLVTSVRLHFDYRVVVEPGDRVAQSPAPADEPIELLVAKTHHCWVRVDSGRPARIPDSALEILRAAMHGA